MKRAFVGTLAFVAFGCTEEPEFQSWRCSPQQSPACPDGYICCSDDPAALDLDALDVTVLPQYEGRGGTGIPLFSAGNNSLSISGLCVEAGAVPLEGALSDVGAMGCPIPCNPHWQDEELAEVCGNNTLCCQTLELEPEDCVFDADLGDSGCWRPVTGLDIVGLGGLDASHWESSEHATHQDPEGNSCKTFVTGVPDDVLDAKGITADELQRACLRRLGVADARGFCLGKSPTVSACPLDDPSYRDACEQRNDEQGRTSCD
jgi:hypothetical protein